jgi:hypothetical protein
MTSIAAGNWVVGKTHVALPTGRASWLVCPPRHATPHSPAECSSHGMTTAIPVVILTGYSSEAHSTTQCRFDTLSIASATALGCFMSRSAALPERLLPLHIGSPRCRLLSLDCTVQWQGPHHRCAVPAPDDTGGKRPAAKQDHACAESTRVQIGATPGHRCSAAGVCAAAGGPRLLLRRRCSRHRQARLLLLLRRRRRCEVAREHRRRPLCELRMHGPTARSVNIRNAVLSTTTATPLIRVYTDCVHRQDVCSHSDGVTLRQAAQSSALQQIKSEAEHRKGCQGVPNPKSAPPPAGHPPRCAACSSSRACPQPWAPAAAVTPQRARRWGGSPAPSRSPAAAATGPAGSEDVLIINMKLHCIH